MTPDPLVIWAGAVCTLAIFSILYKENPVFRLFEHIFIGLGAGYGVAVIWTEILKPKWWEPFYEEGHWYWVFAFLIGIMYYFIYSRKYVWVSRLLIGALMGMSAGTAFQGFAMDQIPQLAKSFKPLVTAHAPYFQFNHLVFLVTLVSVMTYFFFSFERKNVAIRGGAQLGRWLLMISFGAIFGSTVMARMSLFIDRLLFLLGDWLHLIR